MTTEPRVRLDFQVLVYPEDGFWIAHCLETDLAAEGSNPKSAFASLIDITNALVENAVSEGDIRSVFSPYKTEAMVTAKRGYVYFRITASAIVMVDTAKK